MDTIVRSADRRRKPLRALALCLGALFFGAATPAAACDEVRAQIRAGIPTAMIRGELIRRGRHADLACLDPDSAPEETAPLEAGPDTTTPAELYTCADVLEAAAADTTDDVLEAWVTRQPDLDMCVAHAHTFLDTPRDPDSPQYTCDHAAAWLSKGLPPAAVVRRIAMSGQAELLECMAEPTAIEASEAGAERTQARAITQPRASGLTKRRLANAWTQPWYVRGGSVAAVGVRGRVRVLDVAAERGDHDLVARLSHIESQGGVGPALITTGVVVTAGGGVVAGGGTILSMIGLFQAVLTLGTDTTLLEAGWGLVRVGLIVMPIGLVVTGMGALFGLDVRRRRFSTRVHYSPREVEEGVRLHNERVEAGLRF